MTAQSQLEAYLGDFRNRLRALIVARGAALLAITAVAITLVELGLSLTGVRTALNIERGMDLLRSRIEARGRGFADPA